ncbi:M48 family metalloprotease [candidate division KSB1 bacterium]|nr:M48 family metalloprotease [candidate division KSB1 bacterium]
MSRKLAAIPDYHSLEREFKKLCIKSGIKLFIVIFIDLVSIIYFYNSNFNILNKCNYFAIFAGIFLSMLYFGAPIKLKPVRIEDFKNYPIGNFTKSQIKNLLRSIDHELNSKNNPTIYIIKDKLKGPFAISTLLFKSKKKVNSVYIPEYLFYILNSDELEAILLHEMGHVEKYMLPLMRFIFPIYFFTFLAPIYLYYFFPVNFFIPVYILSLFIMLRYQKKFFIEKSTTQEYLADFFSAERVGILNYINGLITSIGYHELIEYASKRLLEHIEKNKKLSVQKYPVLLKNFINDIPYNLRSKRRITALLKKYISSKEIKTFYNDLDEKHLKIEKKIIHHMLVFHFMSDDIKTADWSKFDNYIHNKKIEKQEYEGFIKYLLENENKVLFRDSNEDKYTILMEGMHPSLRDRILFLHKNVKYFATSFKKRKISHH